MRTYHRWISIVFGVFLLWIAATGVMSQVAALVANGGFEQEEREARGAPSAAPARAAAPARFVCPADMTCRPRPPADGARAWVGFLHHLHSGEAFGPAGVVISILSGAALLFFAVSGLWLYLRMWRERRARGLRPGWFWK